MIFTLLKLLSSYSPFFASIQSDTLEVLRGDDILLEDGGPYYCETNLDHVFPEPLNALSAVVFMFISLYWYFKVSKQTQSFRFLKLASIILAIGGLGGSIYHGFRFFSWAMWMDWFPILILCIAAASYFIYRVYKSIFAALTALLLAVLLQFANFEWVPFWLSTSTSYGILAAFILVPLIIALVKTKFLYGYYPAIALLAFILALTFRLLDPHADELFGFCTHFLWHSFGAVACHAMFLYMFKFKRSFPKFELVNRIKIRNMRIANVKKAREIILKRWKNNGKGTS